MVPLVRSYSWTVVRLIDPVVMLPVLLTLTTPASLPAPPKPPTDADICLASGPPIEPATRPVLTLALGLAAAEAIARVAGIQKYVHPTVHYWPLIQSDQARADEFSLQPAPGVRRPQAN